MTCSKAADGVDALKKLTGQKVHLIISDVNMPNMDGITLVSEVKKLPAYKFTPIVMLTTESADGKKAAGQAAGAKAWVLKPFNPPQLLNVVQSSCCPDPRDIMNPSHSFPIAGELTIYRAAELCESLKTALAGLPDGGDLEIDLSAVTEMDSAGVQLLMAVHKSTRASQHGLRLVNPSAAVEEVFETLQLAPHFAAAH